MRQNRRFWLALTIATALAACGLLIGVVRIARADMAPFPAQTGSSLGSASSTDIQMISETVLMSVEPLSVTANSPLSPSALVEARVVADFKLVNPSGSAEKLLVGFPLDVPGHSQGGGYIKLSNLRAFVAETEAETQLQRVGSETWSAWQMSFAPGETDVRVTYDLPATVDSCNTEFGYVLHTGAAWAGPIGRADLIVRFPYAAESTFVSPHGIYLGNSTPGYQVAGNDLHWHYDNLEPTAADDLAITFVTPDCWVKVAAARVALNQQASAENYWHLASAYAEIVFPHHGFYSPLIAQVADAQFQKALSLDPANPQLNIEYAEFLWYHVGYLLPASRQPDEIRQCAKAWLLAPQDKLLAPTCAVFLVSLIGDRQVSPDVQATVAAVLTAAPQPTVAPNATATVMPSATLSPSAQPTDSPLPAATETPLPSRTATAAATQVALLPATPVPAATTTPMSQAASSQPWVPLEIVTATVLVIGAALYLWRSRSSRS